MHREYSRSQSAIALSGDVGSGKSTVAAILAQELKIPLLSTGGSHRREAQNLGISTLELNRRSEGEQDLDHRIDAMLRSIGEEGKAVVLDSRMAWRFVPHALSVHLTVSPLVAAQRICARESPEENYESLDEALGAARARAASERTRFLTLYAVDITRLRNYRVVIDTTSAPPEIVAKEITEFLSGQRSYYDSGKPRSLILSPRSIYPTEGARRLANWSSRVVAELGNSAYLSEYPISVGYSEGQYFVVDGHRRLSACIQAQIERIPARLVGEGSETIVGGIKAADYLKNETLLHILYDWECANGVSLPLPASTD